MTPSAAACKTAHGRNRQLDTVDWIMRLARSGSSSTIVTLGNQNHDFARIFSIARRNCRPWSVNDGTDPVQRILGIRPPAPSEASLLDRVSRFLPCIASRSTRAAHRASRSPAKKPSQTQRRRIPDLVKIWSFARRKGWRYWHRCLLARSRSTALELSAPQPPGASPKDRATRQTFSTDAPTLLMQRTLQLQGQLQGTASLLSGWHVPALHDNALTTNALTTKPLTIAPQAH